jgi:acetyltransferase-like isoleucine patch superfamily enzyme
MKRVYKKLLFTTTQIIAKRKILKNKNSKIGTGTMFGGMPILNFHPQSSIEIGEHVIFNSDKFGYHLNMFAPCKLMADRPNAKIKIGNNTRIHGTCIHAYQYIEIGNNCLIAANTQIMDGNGHDLSFDNPANRIKTTGGVKPVIIEDNVWIGTNVVVLPGVRIGQGSIISANSVVHKDVPPMCIAGGNPVSIIKQFS